MNEMYSPGQLLMASSTKKEGEPDLFLGCIIRAERIEGDREDYYVEWYIPEHLKSRYYHLTDGTPLHRWHIDCFYGLYKSYTTSRVWNEK